jgi:single-strand DNA-binding protein
MYNKVIMIGNLTRDIELKYIPSGAAIAKGAIATSHKYKAQDGSQKEEVCFLDFNVFGKSAEILNQYVKKGSKVMLEGRLVLEQWTAQDGTSRNRHTLRVEEFKFLDSKADSQGGGNNYNAPQQNNQQMGYGQNNMDNGYQAPQQQQQYNQAQQNSYNAPASKQGGMNSAQHSYEQNIPTIDIDNDEIPF